MKSTATLGVPEHLVLSRVLFHSSTPRRLTQPIKVSHASYLGTAMALRFQLGEILKPNGGTSCFKKEEALLLRVNEAKWREVFERDSSLTWIE